MGDLASWSERRRALRVPVVASRCSTPRTARRTARSRTSRASGALVSVAGIPTDKSSTSSSSSVSTRGWVSARTVRVERRPRSAGEIAVAVRSRRPRLRARDRCRDRSRAARRAAPADPRDRRPHRRAASSSSTRLAARGMTPLAPRTPLEAIDLLTRTQLHVNVCLLAPSFGQTTAELRALVSDSFPWVSTAEISDDVEATVDRALEAWSGTDVARLSARSPSHAIAHTVAARNAPRAGNRALSRGATVALVARPCASSSPSPCSPPHRPLMPAAARSSSRRPRSMSALGAGRRRDRRPLDRDPRRHPLGLALLAPDPLRRRHRLRWLVPQRPSGLRAPRDLRRPTTTSSRSTAATSRSATRSSRTSTAAPGSTRASRRSTARSTTNPSTRSARRSACRPSSTPPAPSARRPRWLRGHRRHLGARRLRRGGPPRHRARARAQRRLDRRV